MKRTTVILIAVLVTTLVAGAGVLLARDRLEQTALDRIRARLGEDTTVRNLHVEAGRFTVEGLKTELASGAVRLEAPRSEGTYGMMKLLFSPIKAVNEITVEDARIFIDLDSLLARSGPGDARGSSANEASSFDRLPQGKQIRLENAEIVLQRDGRQLRLRGVDGTFATADGLADLELAGEIENGSFTVALSASPEEIRDLRVEFRDLPGSLLAAAFPSLPLYRGEGVRLNGTLTARAGGEGGFDANFTAEGMGVEHERLGPRPIVLPTMGVKGILHLDPPNRTASLRDGELRLGDAVALFETEVSRSGEGTGLRLVLDIPPTPAQTLIDAVPGGLLGSWEALRVQGDAEASLRFAVHTERPLDTQLEIEVRDRTHILGAPVDSDRYRRPFRHVARGAGDRQYEVETGPGSAAWVPLEEISPFLIHAVLAHEDAAFFGHDGFAPWAVETAVARNLERGRFAFGASTVSMQLARNLLLNRDKTLTRKFREVAVTYWLEKTFSKSEILALYLNVIEYGPGLYGIGNATEHYFSRTPADLTPAEAVFLASILPAPRRHHRQYENGELADHFRGDMESLLRHMAKKDRIDGTALTHGLLQASRFSFRTGSEDPAPHLPLGGAAPLPCSSADISEYRPATPWGTRR